MLAEVWAEPVSAEQVLLTTRFPPGAPSSALLPLWRARKSQRVTISLWCRRFVARRRHSDCPATVQSAVPWPVAALAIDVITRDVLARVMQCPGADEGNLFFCDTRSIGSRRSCSMEGYGSVAKMRRYNARKPQNG